MIRSKITVTNETTAQIDSGQIKAWTELFLEKEQVNIPQIEINFVNTSQIRHLNLSHRQLDEPTDILTFIIPGPVINIGAIYICLDVAKKHSQEKKTELNREIWYLIGHGVKHLAGKHHE